ncbi:MAG TPA: CsbD family protein [Gammaproteobacteria bacterium]|nr:CsbD family protein [Gammaproteobacteria bacterium]
MDWSKIEARWNELKGAAKSRWAALTDDDLERIAGKCDELIGTLQARYGKGRNEIESEVARWARGEILKVEAPDDTRP